MLNKPDKLTKEEFDIMKRHVVDGAHILRRTPEMPALAPIVAFEHHLKQDLSGYPEKIGSRKLNLCTMIVQHRGRLRRAAQQPRRIARAWRPTRIAAIMGEQGNPAFNQRAAEALREPDGAVSGRQPRAPEHGRARGRHAPNTRTDPFRPQVKIISNRKGEMPRGAAARQHAGNATAAAITRAPSSRPSIPSRSGIDPLTYL